MCRRTSGIRSTQQETCWKRRSGCRHQHIHNWRWQDSNFRSKGHPFKERCNIQEHLVWFKQRCRQVHIRHFLLPNNICCRQERQHCRRANRWCNHWKKSSKDTWKTHRPGFTGQIRIKHKVITSPELNCPKLCRQHKKTCLLYTSPSPRD